MLTLKKKNINKFWQKIDFFEIFTLKNQTFDEKKLFF